MNTKSEALLVFAKEILKSLSDYQPPQLPYPVNIAPSVDELQRRLVLEVRMSRVSLETSITCLFTAHAGRGSGL
jgi:hypothetical protein